MNEDPTDVLNRQDVLNFLVDYRQRKGIRQVDVAAAMGIGQPSVSELERGQTNPRMDTIQKYARALGLELTYMVRGMEDGDED